MDFCIRTTPRLELVVVRVERRDLGLEALAFPDVHDELLELAALLERRYRRSNTTYVNTLPNL